MKVKLHCVIHDADVIPAGYNLNWIPTNLVNVDRLVKPEDRPEDYIYASEFELDYADLYCTGGEGDHEFLALITLNTGRTYTDVDSHNE